MIRRIGVCLFSTLLLAGCGSAELKEFVSTEGKFKALFPGKPKEQTQTQAGITTKAFGVDQGGGAYMVSFADTKVPAKQLQAEAKQRLDGARDGSLNASNAKLVAEKEITLDGHPGRQVDSELVGKKGFARTRFYIVGSMLYSQIVIGSSRDFTTSETATKFLDSLALTK